MERECDNCGKIYDVKPADIKRGWGLTCSKKCAAEKREKSKAGYNIDTVELNNLKRSLWNNKYRKQELKLRKQYPEWSDIDIWTEMYKITNDPIFLTDKLRNVFFT